MPKRRPRFREIGISGVDTRSTYDILREMAKRRKQFSAEIREAVRLSGLSHNRICVKAGIDRGYFSRFMSGKSNLGLNTLDRLAVVLDLHVTRGKGK